MAGRRYPVYLVLDTSGSMAGDAIEAVRQGIKLLVSELQGEPSVLEIAYLSVITFSSTAQQVVPLTELVSFQEPTIDAGGSTALGEALQVLVQCVDREVVKQGATKGDYKPLVCIMTDGQPTDSWERAADKVKSRHWNVIACAAGAGADTSVLKHVTENVLKLSDCQPGTLKAFFKLMTQTMTQHSKTCQQVAADAPVQLPPPPPGIQIVP